MSQSEMELKGIDSIMPNWTRNKIIVGSEEKMAELVKAHCPIDKESGRPEMDFDTIDPMPKDLSDTVYGTESYDGLSLYLARRNPKVRFFGTMDDKMGDDDFIELRWLMVQHKPYSDFDDLTREGLARIKAKYNDPERLKRLEAVGEQVSYNIRHYGAANWYEWSLAHWGVKWDACDTEVNGPEMTFDTAWDPALPVLIKMSAMHPKMPMAFLYADEQTGARVGFVLIKGGNIDQSGSFPDFSVDAYKLSFNVWGNGDEYRFDEKKNTYVRKELRI